MKKNHEHLLYNFLKESFIHEHNPLITVEARFNLSFLSQMPFDIIHISKFTIFSASVDMRDNSLPSFKQPQRL